MNTHHTNTQQGNTPAESDTDQLLPLMMPEGEPPADAVALEEDDDEELDNKTAHRKLIESFTDDEGEKNDINLFYIIRGDILTAKWLRKQILWLIMLVVLAFVYVSNRYGAQEQMIHNNKLKDQLKEIHYNAMARSSELMRNCRRSTIMEQLENNPSNTRIQSDKQPAIIEEE